MTEPTVSVPVPAFLWEQTQLKAAAVTILTGQPLCPRVLLAGFVAAGLRDMTPTWEPEEAPATISTTQPLSEAVDQFKSEVANHVRSDVSLLQGEQAPAATDAVEPVTEAEPVPASAVSAD